MNKMTPKIMNAAYSARGGGDCKELFLNSIFATYADENKDIKKDQVSQIFLGKCTIPKAIVRFYAAGASLCPTRLYCDISTYYQDMRTETIRILKDGLYEVLDTIPEEDREVVLRETNASTESERILKLLASLMYYAWRTDLAKYTFSSN